MQKITLLLFCFFLTASLFAKRQNNPGPDLIVKASMFRIDAEHKRIYFKVWILNIGSGPAAITNNLDIQTYLSADNQIGNDAASGGRLFPNLWHILPSGDSLLLTDEQFLNYTSATVLQNNPYCVIEINYNRLINERNYDNNKSIYKHGFPRRKGEGLQKNPPGNIPTKLSEKNRSVLINPGVQVSGSTAQLIKGITFENGCIIIEPGYRAILNENKKLLRLLCQKIIRG